MCPTCRRETHLEEGSVGPTSLRVNLTVQSLISVIANDNKLGKITDKKNKKDDDQLSVASGFSKMSGASNFDKVEKSVVTTV